MQYFRPSFGYHLLIRYLFFSVFEWPFYTGFTVPIHCLQSFFVHFNGSLVRCFFLKKIRSTSMSEDHFYFNKQLKTYIVEYVFIIYGEDLALVECI